jgi:hypothetical protein
MPAENLSIALDVIELRPSNEKSSWWKEAEEKMIAQFCLFTSKI